MTMKTMEKVNVSVEVKRGDVFVVHEPKMELTHGLQSGKRIYVVVGNNIGCRFSPILLMVPLTSQKKKKMPTHVYVDATNGLNYDSTILCEQIKTIPKEWLGEKVASLDESVMTGVDQALIISLGLPMVTETVSEPKPVEPPVIKQVEAAQMTKRPATPIMMDSGKRSTWAEKSKRSNFVAPSIVPIKKEVK